MRLYKITSKDAAGNKSVSYVEANDNEDEALESFRKFYPYHIPETIKETYLVRVYGYRGEDKVDMIEDWNPNEDRPEQPTKEIIPTDFRISKQGK